MMTGANGRGGRRSALSTSSSSVVTLFLTLSGISLVAFHLISTIVFPHSSSAQTHREPFSHPIDPGVPVPRELGRSSLSGKPFHVAMTASDSPYNKWQSRIMYYWYKKVKDVPGSEMGGFTRILHSRHADDLMDEIPTMLVNPLPPGVDRGYVVLNRPWAFVQWLQKAKIEEEYVLMAEPDHVFVRPMPNLARGDVPAAYPFFYIRPKKNEKILRKYYPEEMGPVDNIDPIGNSPVIIKKSLLGKIAPTWMSVSIRMKNDPETDKAFGWVLEMYGYAVASALHGVQHILRRNFMVQPPFSQEVGKSFIIHYTYGCDYTLKGKLTNGRIGEWRFDKRSYLRRPIPRNISLPPPGVPESVVTLVKMVNEATANIPGWDSGR